MALPLPSWSTSAALLPSLLLLETVLSADNALALAALVRPLETEVERQRLLNWGLATAVVLRLLAVAAAGVVLRHPLVRVAGGAYLIWLALVHFRGELGSAAGRPAGLDIGTEPGVEPFAEPFAEPSAEPRSSANRPAWIGQVLLLAATNLAFSLDSLCAALALTTNMPLVMLAGAMGVVALRAVASLVLGWMERFPNLANAAYLTVLAVGLRLVLEQLAPPLSPSDPWMGAMLAVLVAWGLRRPQTAEP